MAIAIDASTPSPKTGSGSGTTLTSNSFSPPANGLIVLFNQYDSNGSSVSSVSDSLGTHLNWTKLISSATTSAYADIWVADVGSTAPGSMTVTATWSASNNLASLGMEILVLTGAAPVASQTGTTATATGTSGAPSATLASAAGTSWIFGSVGIKSGTAPTIPSGQTDSFNSITQRWNSSTKEGFVQGNTGPGNSNLRIDDTAPTGTWAISVAEIIAAASGTQHNQSESGALSASGAVIKQITKILLAGPGEY